jgi:hypothetical protein
MPDWAEQVTAIATAVSALALLGAIGAVIFAARQARETRIGRQAETALEFFRRWNEGPLEETRRLVAQFETREELGVLEKHGLRLRAHPVVADSYPMFDHLVTKLRAAG